MAGAVPGRLLPRLTVNSLAVAERRNRRLSKRLDAVQTDERYAADMRRIIEAAEKYGLVERTVLSRTCKPIEAKQALHTLMVAFTQQYAALIFNVMYGTSSDEDGGQDA